MKITEFVGNPAFDKGPEINSLGIKSLITGFMTLLSHIVRM